MCVCVCAILAKKIAQSGRGRGDIFCGPREREGVGIKFQIPSSSCAADICGEGGGGWGEGEMQGLGNATLCVYLWWSCDQSPVYSERNKQK